MIGVAFIEYFPQVQNSVNTLNRHLKVIQQKRFLFADQCCGRDLYRRFTDTDSIHVEKRLVEKRNMDLNTISTD